MGLKHFEGTDFPKPLISKYLLTTKTAHQLTGRIKNRLSQANLPSIQEATEQQRAREASRGSDVDPKAGSDTASPANLECPLRMPEGIQMILRPLSSRFCRRIWRWQRPAVAKPFLVQPSLCLPQAGAGGFLKQPPPAAAPGKLAAHVSPLSQPASLVQPLSAVPSGLGSGPPFELQGVLSAKQPCLAPAVAQNVVSSLPVAFQSKMILPALPASRVRKSPLPRGSQKQKTPLLKAAPVLHPAPVIFTVPAGTVKVLGIANGCNVLQPLSAAPRAAVSAPQSIPITTLLVNPTPFSCPLRQPLAASPALPLVVASSPGPASALGKDSEMAGQPVSHSASGGDTADPVKAKLKTDSEEGPGEAGGPWSSDHNSGVQTEPPVQSYVEVGEGRAAEGLAPAASPLVELGELVKMDVEGSQEIPPSEAASVPPASEGSPMKESLILDLGQGLEAEPAPGSQPRNQHEEEEEEEETVNSAGLQAVSSAEEGSHASPANFSSSVAAASEPSSSVGKGEEVAGAGDRPEGAASAGQEGGGEKDGLEEEEEEDFDDYIPDEEDEMSSASEESETMEKLTWLASERRLSQEGDSEEENSQEENSEPEEEEEEEEEGEGEPVENRQKEDEMADEAVGPGDGPASSLASTCTVPTVEASSIPPGENPKTTTKSRGSHRARAKRGRGRTSKDASKLLLLYDNNILERDPLREQKDFAFAQAYLNRNNLQKQTAVDLYARLQILLQDWPQLLTDFAAFLLPEQALECGLLKNQMWQLLKGHDHLQDEFSVFFDHLRPSASRLGDFEEINWTEEKEYEVGGCLPGLFRSSWEGEWIGAMGRRPGVPIFPTDEADGRLQEEAEWLDGHKDWCGSCHEGSGDPRLKRSKRRSCAHCCSKVGEPKGPRSKEPGELAEGRGQREPSPRLEGKEPPEGSAERRDDGEAVPGRIRAASRKGESAGGGARPEGKPLSSRDAPPEGLLPPPGKAPESSPPPAPPCPPNGGEPARNSPVAAPLPPRGASPPKPQRLKSSLGPTEGKREVGLGPRSGEPPAAPKPDRSETGSPSKAARPIPGSAPSLVPSRLDLTELDVQPPSVSPKARAREMLPVASEDLAPKALGASEGLPAPPEIPAAASLQAANPTGKPSEGGDVHSHKEEGLTPVAVGGPVAGEDPQQRTIEATVCAKNIKVSSTGEKVVLWTSPPIFHALRITAASSMQVAHRFRELMTLFHTACEVSSDDEEDGMSTSNADQLSDKEPALSEDDPEEPGF
ncbi:hypothetical protein Chor_005119 [Crotalus horridus]